MTEAELRAELRDAHAAGDTARAAGAANQLRQLTRPVRENEAPLPRVGGFQPRNQRELELARRVVQLRNEGQRDSADRVLMSITASRVADRRSQQGRGASTALGLGLGNLFGAGDYLGAAVQSLKDGAAGREGPSFENRVFGQQEVRRILAEREPVANAVGEITGAVATLPAAAASGGRVAQLLRLSPSSAGGRAGQIGRGVARAAGAGAAGAAVQGAANRAAEQGFTSENVAEGATRGAATGAAVGAGAAGIAAVAAPFLRAAGNRLATDNGLRAMAERIRVPIADLRASATRFQQQFNRPATLAEVLEDVDPTLSAEAGQIVSRSSRASAEATQAADALRSGRQREVAEAILPGSSTRSNIAGEATDAGMATIENTAVSLAPGSPGRAFFDSPDTLLLTRRLLPSQRAQLAEALDNGGEIPVRLLDHLRQAANRARGPGAPHDFGTVSEQATTLADQATGGAFSRIVRREHRALATREDLASRALASPNGAERVAEELRTGAATARDLPVNLGDPAEAARLQRVGQTASTAARGVDAVTPPRIRSAGDDQSDAVARAARASQANRMGGAGFASMMTNELRALGVGANGATRLARDLLDPARADAAMTRLERMVGRRGSREVLDAVRQTMARQTGAAVAASGGEELPQAREDGQPEALTPPVRIEDQAQLRQLHAATPPPGDRETLMAQLREAHAAGNAERARALAASIRALGEQ